MSPTLHSKLYDAIKAVIDEESQGGKRDFWVYERLVADMTHAARMIYDACRQASIYVENEVK